MSIRTTGCKTPYGANLKHDAALRQTPYSRLLATGNDANSTTSRATALISAPTLLHGAPYRIQTRTGQQWEATFDAVGLLMLCGPHHIPLSLDRVVSVAWHGDWVAIGAWYAEPVECAA